MARTDAGWARRSLGNPTRQLWRRASIRPSDRRPSFSVCSTARQLWGPIVDMLQPLAAECRPPCQMQPQLEDLGQPWNALLLPKSFAALVVIVLVLVVLCSLHSRHPARRRGDSRPLFLCIPSSDDDRTKAFDFLRGGRPRMGLRQGEEARLARGARGELAPVGDRGRE